MEKSLFSERINALISSLQTSPPQQWLHLHEKHLNELYSADDELLKTLENFSNSVLNGSEDDTLHSEAEALSAQYVLNGTFLNLGCQTFNCDYSRRKSRKHT